MSDQGQADRERRAARAALVAYIYDTYGELTPDFHRLLSEFESAQASAMTHLFADGAPAGPREADGTSREWCDTCLAFYTVNDCPRCASRGARSAADAGPSDLDSLIETITSCLGYERLWRDVQPGSPAGWFLERASKQYGRIDVMPLGAALRSADPAAPEGAREAFALIVPYLKHDIRCRSDEDEGCGPCTCGLQRYLAECRAALSRSPAETPTGDEHESQG